MNLVYTPTPRNFAEPLCSISLGTTVIPRRNWKQRYATFFLGGGGGGTGCIVVYVKMMKGKQNTGPCTNEFH